MKNSTPIALDRMSKALERHGVRLKRTQLLQIAAAALGYRNVHELAAADDAGDLHPPPARYMGRTRVSNIGWMHFFQDPDGTVFSVDQEKFDALEGRAADWILSPLGGLLDVSAVNPATRPTLTKESDAGNSCTEIDASSDWWARTVINPNQPAYMTNGCCEVAAVTQTDLDTLGLPYGSWEEAFYPLTDEEAQYIAEDLVDALDGLHSALIGYSVLYQGGKYLMPTIEIACGEDGQPTRAKAHADAVSYAKRIMPKAKSMGGNILIDSFYADRILVEILIPFEAAMSLGGFETWKARLAWLMTDPLVPASIVLPSRLEGQNYAVEVDWLGEGNEGDYDPMDPSDIPLLRFDVQLRDNHGWQDCDHASYCTQVPAWSSEGDVQSLLRYLLNQLEVEAGTSIKRLCERLSWTSLSTVREFASYTPNDARK